MKSTRGIIAAFACAAFLAASGAAFAETPASPPQTTPPPAAKVQSPEKAAISKACSAQADAQGLQGKPRKKFRSECKKKGGKAD